ncbi:MULTISPECIES: M20 metallopeptidase family protein [Butyricimonas]|uniref:M20 metallopeptidase family protein n=1 Tax=Butyricimonas TaxID=574697 RepID=UPI001D099E67|nr:MULTISPECIES: M20 family metallopeptidase [Butyricimonas]MCB6970909.1 M20 family metallopeptidase [Butyricimonas synergistica]MCG4517623.1 M20 family metallopeptidase [Butyricimonas sp. DFI.6.44]
MSVEDIFPLAVEFRRHFHQHPEFAMQEVETQRYITKVLDKYGIVYRTVGTGVIAMIGQGEKCVAIRADMDALKVTEETGLPFCSLTPGMMHACGHDMHMAMVLGAAVVLKSREQELNGMVKVIFQPSEEKRPGGARLLLPELLKAPVPQAIFGQHVFPNLPTGTIGIRSGAFFASSDNIIFSVEGKGTHAAMPHMGSDPILATACLIQFYQTLVTKFRDPLIPAVISITSVHGGTCNNVIPDKVEVLGTVRTHDNTLRYRLFELIEQKSKEICELYGCTFTMDKTWNGLPVLVNDEQLTKFVTNNATELLGEDRVISMNHLTLGEDFAIYLEKIPGAFWVLGVRPPEQENMPPLHNPKMSPDENAIKIGIALMVKNCLQYFI